MLSRVEAMRSRLKLKHKGLILVCVPLLFEIGFVGVLTYKLHEAEVETDKEARAREIVTLSFRLGHSFYAIGWNLASYAQKQDQQSAENFRQGLAALERDRSHLLKLIEEEPVGLEKYRRFEKVLLVAENTCRRIETVMQGGLEFGEVLSMRGQLELIIQKLAQRQREFVEGYEKIQEQSPGKQRSIRENQRVVLLGALLFNVALTVVLALFFARSITGRLGVLTENTRRLALEQELAPQLTGSDEIADLDRVFHIVSSSFGGGGVSL